MLPDVQGQGRCQRCRSEYPCLQNRHSSSHQDTLSGHRLWLSSLRKKAPGSGIQLCDFEVCALVTPAVSLAEYLEACDYHSVRQHGPVIQIEI